MARIRADQLLVNRGLAESRPRAQALILAGLVYVGEKKLAKAGDQLPLDAVLDVRGRDHPWVSRGGIKLDHALTFFGWDVTGAVAIDVGSSTGGFTDVLLTRGAAKVYAVDSGTNQLAWKLRQDERVTVWEKTNARNLTDAEIPEAVDLIVCDASFIGLAKVLDRPITFAKPDARMVALIKPQFEAGREEVGKGGVVRDAAVHERVCAEARAWATSKGWRVVGIEKSPITGPEGNVEFLLAATHGDSRMTRDKAWIVTVPGILLLGWLSGWLSGSGYGNAWFDALTKPGFMPPGWAFGIAWTILYILMGVAVAQVIARAAPVRDLALRIFTLQLVLNLLWSPVFFAMHQVQAALAIIVVLTFDVALAIMLFWKIRRSAALLMLPYLAWLLFATALNVAILRLNP